ncbi:MAG: asparagine synthase (glutamine-hydrolyzing), partial [Gammaproteobacteria bacterium]
MCGLAGWFSPSPIPANQRLQLEAMIRSIAHRGPDDNGCLLQDHAALGHVRLSIIDIAGGHQPMTDEEQPVSIVFNGEIYNFIELRDRLIRRGVRFRTRCDTEVILQIYLHDGPQAFSELRGMFAFAIWDGRNNTGLLVRDPCGIKPLFLTVKSSGELQFASEAKAILAKDSRATGELNEIALHLLMNYRYLPGDLSLFRNIRQLPPGTVLEWRDDGTIRETLLSDAASTSVSDNVLGTLEESIKLHFTADVEVGAYLSGGLDSALIASLGRDSGHPELRTFTLDVGDDPNESRNAARTAELLGVKNLLGNSNTDLNEILPRLIWHLEVPKVNALQVNQLARHAAQHVK